MGNFPCLSPLQRGPPTSTRNSGTALGGIRGTLGFALARRTSLTHVTLTGVVLGKNRPKLQQVWDVWNFALNFKREALSYLDVAFLLEADLRTKTLRQPFATDASPD